MLYTIHNTGQYSLGHGLRSVLAVNPGRKWVTLIDWSHPCLERCKIGVSDLNNLQAIPLTPRLRRTILRSLKGAYVEKTELVKEAISQLKQGE